MYEWRFMSKLRWFHLDVKVFMCIVSFAAIQLSSGGQECLSCSGIENANDCDHFVSCADDEVCSMQHYTTESGSSGFDFGCTSSQACVHSVGSIFGRRSEGHHIKCTLCCNDTKLCNGNLKCINTIKPGSNLPRECSDLSNNRSGVYTIYPYGTEQPSVPVFCEVDSSGIVWTVIQRRYNGSVKFYRDWQDYKEGFGYPNGEYWLGNDFLHELTSTTNHDLKIVLTDFDGVTKNAEYTTFHVGNEANEYKLFVDNYQGDAGDSFSGHSGYKFSTFDRDNDVSTAHCAFIYKGAWWYSNCYSSNLNGVYLAGHRDRIFATGINWQAWHGYYYSLKTTEMMIRKT